MAEVEMLIYENFDENFFRRDFGVTDYKSKVFTIRNWLQEIEQFRLILCFLLVWKFSFSF